MYFLPPLPSFICPFPSPGAFIPPNILPLQTSTLMPSQTSMLIKPLHFVTTFLRIPKTEIFIFTQTNLSLYQIAHSFTENNYSPMWSHQSEQLMCITCIQEAFSARYFKVKLPIPVSRNQSLVQPLTGL